jgi:mono/diheme cytochrome c family protein
MRFTPHLAPWSFALAAVVGPALLVGRGRMPPESSGQAGAAAYKTYCAGCHGRGGRGDGPLASQLATHPPDLTTLSRGNEGSFPFERVYAAIDGRRPVKAHGPMPPWGEAFRSSDDGGDAARVKERITQITRFVESLQRPAVPAKDRP